MLKNQLGTFEETFGDNKGADAWFIISSDFDNSSLNQAPYTQEKFLTELEMLSNETLDRQILDKVLQKAIDWLLENPKEVTVEFLREVEPKMRNFLENALDQIGEMDYNSVMKMRLCMKELSESNEVAKILMEFEKEANLMSKLEDKYKEMLAEFTVKTKAIKKEKMARTKQKQEERKMKKAALRISGASNALWNDGNRSVTGEKKPEFKVEIKEEGEKQENFE